MALPRDFDLRTLLRAGESQRAKTPAGLAAREGARSKRDDPDDSDPDDRAPKDGDPKDGAPRDNGSKSRAPTSTADGPDGRTGRSTGRARDRPAGREDRFLDRAEGWLRAGGRLLELAEDHRVPLLERTRYLATLAAHLDATFAGENEGCTSVHSPDARGLAIRHAYCFHHVVLPALARAGIELVRWDNLTAPEKESLDRLFRERVYPVLTPLAVDPVRTLPNVPALAVNLAVLVRDPGSAAHFFARVGLPASLPRFVRVADAASNGSNGPDAPERFVPLEDLVAAHLPRLFSGVQVLEHHPFRVTRAPAASSDPAGPPARLEVEESITPEVLDTLVREFGVAEGAVHRMPGPLDLTGLACVANLDRPDLAYPRFVPATHPELLRATERASAKGGAELFAVLRGRDVLLHHPYDSFETSVQALVEGAAIDPHTLAVKVVLGVGDPRIVEPLAAAAQAGKHVAVVVTGSARHPRRAPGWVRLLHEAGCQVGYGIDGARTYVPAVLVVRREDGGRLGRYCHVGTGDYDAGSRNPGSAGVDGNVGGDGNVGSVGSVGDARPREDIGLLTADREVADDLTDLFNHLTGYARPPGYRRLLVGPRSLRPGLVNRIDREIGHHRSGRPARIRVKANAVADDAVADALYRAAQAGVPVEMWVRDVCVLRPGVNGLSETLRVRSIVGRFLEHSRILAFANGGDEEVWIGSADLVPEDLDRRVGVFVRVTAAKHRRQLVRLLDTALDDRTLGWTLHADGTWSRRTGDADGRPPLDLYEHLIRSRCP